MKVALIQMDIAHGNPEENIRRVRERLDQVQTLLGEEAEGAVAVLPEMWNTSYALEDLEKLADRDGAATLALAREWTQSSGCHLVAGSVADIRQGKIHNTAYVVDRHGEVQGQYTKAHLFRLMEEQKYITAGNEPCLFELDGIPCGLIICYDLRFPEWMRLLALGGAKVIFVPAQWPEARLYAWRSLLIARAIENQCYVIGVNRPGLIDEGNPDKGRFPGHSLVIDPLGQVVVEGSDQDEILVAELDLARVDKMRRHIPVFQDRRPELYGDLGKK